MAEPIRFYFDFASPYAYFALGGIEALAGAHGRELDWRPVLIWAVLRAQAIPAPMDAPAKRDYLLADMARSAAFHGVAYHHPEKLPSTHKAARLYYAIAERDGPAARRFGRAVFQALFADGRDIADTATLVGLAYHEGVPEGEAEHGTEGPLGRAKLAAAVETAVADGVCGSPYFILDGEGFFGADRLPQIDWRLSGQGVKR
jgi:2-hydroxychromene-2-carboxylate isomerase